MSIKKHGDTIIEVMMALAVFAVLAIITVNLMNSGINNAQRTLEYTMARNEIDSQAEALRYIHQSYVAERQLDSDNSQFRRLWDALRRVAIKSRNLEDHANNNTEVKFDINNIETCGEAYQTNGMVEFYNAFALNTRMILPDSGNNATYGGDSYANLIPEIIVGIDSLDASSRRVLTAPVVYPRIVYKKAKDAVSGARNVDAGASENNDEGALTEKQIYNRVARAEGVFVIAVGDNDKDPMRSNYFDFYIRTCWHSVGSIAPSTITTIVRLYNPEVLE